MFIAPTNTSGKKSPKDGTAFESNDLVGVTEGTTEFLAGQNYVLSSKGAQTAFVKMAANKTVESMVGKAYLNIPANAESKAFILIEGNTATGIENIETSSANAVMYNIAGQRVNSNAKGIVIKDGKKFIVK